MKAIKISLVVIVISTISFFVIRSLVSTDNVGDIQQSGNLFVDKIRLEIKGLQEKSENKFCNEYYTEVAYHIDDYHKNGKFGQNKLENDQWKENLSKQLYASYSDKFIKQTFNIFKRSDWLSADLIFIRKEYQVLLSSKMLERNSPIDRRFNEIKAILNKYDEISDFIKTCKNFTISQTGLDISFPIDEVKMRILTAVNYRNNRMGNPYVNNCTLLHNELKNIPQILFGAHVKYLDNIINTWSNMFANYNSQKSYVNGLYNPLANKIEELDSEIYKVDNFTYEYSRLKKNWEADATKAYGYFN